MHRSTRCLRPLSPWTATAAGLGRLLAQQLIAAGERVVDVPPTLTARVRLLGSSKASKNDPNDAFATAIAGLRQLCLRTVTRDGHTAILRLARLATVAPMDVARQNLRAYYEEEARLRLRNRPGLSGLA